MTHGNLDKFELDLSKATLVSGYKLFMMPKSLARAVVCPNSELVIVSRPEMKEAYQDLTTWALQIDSYCQNQ